MVASLTLFHVSDLHFGAQDDAALDWFAAEVATHRPDWVICTGDLTMRARHREYAAARRWLASLAAPVLVEPGNHDMPYFNLIERFSRPYARFQALRDAVSTRPALAGLAVVSLKTVARAQWRINWSKGNVADRDLAHALAGLTAAHDAGLRLVAGHHPLIEADTHSTASTRGGKPALATLARAGAHAVLSGHVHDPFDLTLHIDGQPIRLIGAGTLSHRLRASRPSYNRLEWTPDTGLHVAAQLMD